MNLLQDRDQVTIEKKYFYKKVLILKILKIRWFESTDIAEAMLDCAIQVE